MSALVPDTIRRPSVPVVTVALPTGVIATVPPDGATVTVRFASSKSVTEMPEMTLLWPAVMVTAVASGMVTTGGLTSPIDRVLSIAVRDVSVKSTWMRRDADVTPWVPLKVIDASVLLMSLELPIRVNTPRPGRRAPHRPVPSEPAGHWSRSGGS